MTRLLVDPATDFDDPAAVTLTATLLDPGPALVRTFTGVTADTVVDLPAPGTAEAWRLTIRRPRTTTTRWGTASTDPGPIVEERTVHFTGATPLAWAALTDIDPGTLQTTAVPGAAWDAAIGDLRAQIAALPTGGGTGGGTVADASTSTKGLVRLTGDLAGTADAPTVPGLITKAPLASPAFTGTPTIGGVAVAKVTDVGSGTGSSGGGAVLTDVGYDVIVLAGQSNMVGINSGGTVDTARLDVTDPRVWAYNPFTPYQGISLAIDPLVQRGTGYGVGPGTGFARWYAGLIPGNRKVLLVPVAAGGTSLGGTVTPRWSPDLAGSLYDDMVTFTQAALAAAGPGARVAAVLWGQGENDGDAGRTQAQYTADLLTLVDNVRTSFGNRNLPFSIIGMTPEGIGASAGRAAVDAAQRALPGLRAFTSYTAGVSGYSDGTHYTAAGQRLNGMNLARGYATATMNTAAPASTYPYTAPRTPAQVGTVTVTAGNAQLGLAWAAPASNGSTITGYQIVATPSGDSAVATNTGSTATAATLTGLVNGTTYAVTVAATNAVGTGPASAPVTGIPAGAVTVPGAPTGLTVTAGDAQAALTWSPPASNGGAAVSNYLVEYQPSGGSFTTFSHTASASTSITVTGLTNSTAYTFRVSAINSAGTGTASATATATPAAAVSGTTETWTGANGAAWPAAWTTTGVETIQGNQGDMTTASYFAAAVRSAMTGTTGNLDYILQWALTGQTGNTTLRIGVSDQLNNAGGAEPLNGYSIAPVVLSVTNGGSVGGLSIARHNAGTKTDLATMYPSITPGVGGFKMRVNRTGSTIQAKLWPADAAEPGSWTITTTDASPLSTVQKVFIGSWGDTATHLTCDNLAANWT